MSALHTYTPSSAVTASGAQSGKAVPSIAANTIGVIVNATAVSGTSPSLTVKVQWSADNVNFFDASPTADALGAITAVGGGAGSFTIKGPYYRIAYTVAGTSPSFTFTASVHFA